MSQLIDCPACGKKVSPNAAACPACAEPIRPERTNQGGLNLRDPVHVAGLIVCAVILLGVVYMAFATYNAEFG